MGTLTPDMANAPIHTFGSESSPHDGLTRPKLPQMGRSEQNINEKAVIRLLEIRNDRWSEGTREVRTRPIGTHVMSSSMRWSADIFRREMAIINSTICKECIAVFIVVSP